MLAPQLPALAAAVEKLRLHSALSAEDLDALIALPVRHVSAGTGTYLFREGDIPHSCVVLFSGSAYRHKITKNGARQLLAVDHAGDLIGLDQGLLGVTDYSVQTFSPADVGFIPFHALLDLSAAVPNIGKALWRDACLGAAVAREWTVNIGKRDARQRVAHLICELALRRGNIALSDGDTIDWPMTQEQVGDAVGLTPVHVNRTLQGMRTVGMIGTEKRTLTILDWATLRDTADFNPAYLHLRSSIAVN